MSDSKKDKIPPITTFGKMLYADLVKLRERDWKESDFAGARFIAPDLVPYFTELNKVINCRERDADTLFCDICSQLCMVPEGLRNAVAKYLFTLLDENSKFILVKNQNKYVTVFRYMEKLILI